MGIEEDLFNTLKHFSLGGKGKLSPKNMFGPLIKTIQINTLREFQVKLAKVQEDVNKRIEELSKQEAGVSGGKVPDPFTVLGIRPDATKEEVKKAYKEKAASAHPDRGGTNEQMILVNAAYEAIMRFKEWK